MFYGTADPLPQKWIWDYKSVDMPPQMKILNTVFSLIYFNYFYHEITMHYQNVP